jgi:hypothetical protein
MLCSAASSFKKHWRSLDEGDAVQDKGKMFGGIDMEDRGNLVPTYGPRMTRLRTRGELNPASCFK